MTEKDDQIMADIVLIEPTLDFEEGIGSFRQEIIDSADKDRFAGCGDLERSLAVMDWILTVQRMSAEETCPAHKVPSSTWIALREKDQEIVGIIELRHHIDHPILSTWGGHIGYSVRPRHRRLGYASEMLKQCLEHARKRGLTHVLVTCNEDNIASEKTILHNGGSFQNTIEVDGSRMKRYWIDL